MRFLSGTNAEQDIVIYYEANSYDYLQSQIPHARVDPTMHHMRKRDCVPPQGNKYFTFRH